MAEICVALRMTPSEYWALSHDETVALIDAHNKHHQKR